VILSNQTLHLLFEEQVVRTPDNIAVESEDGSRLTYLELNTSAHKLALVLKENKVEADDVVGLIADRTIDMVIGILGILKAGAAYLPIDPNLPTERISRLTRDCNISMLVADEKYLQLSKQLDSGFHKTSIEVEDREASNLEEAGAEERHLACVLAGSVQVPAVMLEHRQVRNLVFGIQEQVFDRYTYSNCLRVGLLSSYSRSDALAIIFCTLLLGHTLCLVPAETATDGDLVLDFFIRHKIGVSGGSAAQFHRLADAVERSRRVPDLKHFMVFLTSEDTPINLQLTDTFLNRFKRRRPRLTALSEIKEIGLPAAFYDIVGNEPAGLVGEALLNQQLWVLNENKEPVANGETGTLYLGGECLPRGFLNQVEETGRVYYSGPVESALFNTGYRALFQKNGLVRRIS